VDGWMLVAGKGLGEDVTNDAAGRPAVAAWEGRPGEERVGEKGKGRWEEAEMGLRH